jgi:hypothetical protein
MKPVVSIGAFVLIIDNYVDWDTQLSLSNGGVKDRYLEALPNEKRLAIYVQGRVRNMITMDTFMRESFAGSDSKTDLHTLYSQME